MKPKEKFLAAVSHRILVYQKIISATIKHLLGKTYYNREKDYYGYIGETKQLNCPHKNVSKLSSTKFYCSECGKTFHFVKEEISILSELLGMLLVGSLVYLLSKKKK
jgi:hypothetical protein